MSQEEVDALTRPKQIIIHDSVTFGQKVPFFDQPGYRTRLEDNTIVGVPVKATNTH